MADVLRAILYPYEYLLSPARPPRSGFSIGCVHERAACSPFTGRPPVTQGHKARPILGLTRFDAPCARTLLQCSQLHQPPLAALLSTWPLWRNRPPQTPAIEPLG